MCFSFKTVAVYGALSKGKVGKNTFRNASYPRYRAVDRNSSLAIVIGQYKAILRHLQRIMKYSDHLLKIRQERYFAHIPDDSACRSAVRVEGDVTISFRRCMGTDKNGGVGNGDNDPRLLGGFFPLVPDFQIISNFLSRLHRRHFSGNLTINAFDFIGDLNIRSVTAN